MACLVPLGDVTPQTTTNVSNPLLCKVWDYEILSDLSFHLFRKVLGR